MTARCMRALVRAGCATQLVTTHTLKACVGGGSRQGGKMVRPVGRPHCQGTALSMASQRRYGVATGAPRACGCAAGWARNDAPRASAATRQTPAGATGAAITRRCEPGRASGQRNRGGGGGRGSAWRCALRCGPTGRRAERPAARAQPPGRGGEGRRRNGRRRRHRGAAEALPRRCTAERPRNPPRSGWGGGL